MINFEELLCAVYPAHKFMIRDFGRAALIAHSASGPLIVEGNGGYPFDTGSNSDMQDSPLSEAHHAGPCAPARRPSGCGGNAEQQPTMRLSEHVAGDAEGSDGFSSSIKEL